MDSDDWRSLLVLVSGAPGSGKTTLARKLAAELSLPHLNRDQIWSGLRFTVGRGAPGSIATRGIAAEYGAMEHLLALGVSLVADGTMYRGDFEGHVRRLKDIAEVVNVHCRADLAAERYRERQEGMDLPPVVFDRQMKRLEEIWDLVVEPLELGCQLIEVTTDDGYDPTLDRLVASLRAQPDLSEGL